MRGPLHAPQKNCITHGTFSLRRSSQEQRQREAPPAALPHEVHCQKVCPFWMFDSFGVKSVPISSTEAMHSFISNSLSLPLSHLSRSCKQCPSWNFPWNPHAPEFSSPDFEADRCTDVGLTTEPRVVAPSLRDCVFL